MMKKQVPKVMKVYFSVDHSSGRASASAQVATVRRARIAARPFTRALAAIATRPPMVTEFEPRRRVVVDVRVAAELQRQPDQEAGDGGRHQEMQQVPAAQPGEDPDEQVGEDLHRQRPGDGEGHHVDAVGVDEPAGQEQIDDPDPVQDLGLDAEEVAAGPVDRHRDQVDRHDPEQPVDEEGPDAVLGLGDQVAGDQKAAQREEDVDAEQAEAAGPGGDRVEPGGVEAGGDVEDQHPEDRHGADAVEQRRAVLAQDPAGRRFRRGGGSRRPGEVGADIGPAVSVIGGAPGAGPAAGRAAGAAVLRRGRILQLRPQPVRRPARRPGGVPARQAAVRPAAPARAAPRCGSPAGAPAVSPAVCIHWAQPKISSTIAEVSPKSATVARVRLSPTIMIIQPRRRSSMTGSWSKFRRPIRIIALRKAPA